MIQKEKVGDDLKKEAMKYGVSLSGLYSNTGVLDEALLQQRVRSAKSASLNKYVSVIAAIASITGAIAAWIAVFVD